MKPWVLKVALTGGIVWGLTIFLTTLVSLYTGYGVVFLKWVASIYVGYNISLVGSVIGLVYGFFDVFIGTYIVMLVYNLVNKFVK